MFLLPQLHVTGITGELLQKKVSTARVTRPLVDSLQTQSWWDISSKIKQWISGLLASSEINVISQDVILIFWHILVCYLEKQLGDFNWTSFFFFLLHFLWDNSYYALVFFFFFVIFLRLTHFPVKSVGWCATFKGYLKASVTICGEKNTLFWLIFNQDITNLKLNKILHIS